VDDHLSGVPSGTVKAQDGTTLSLEEIRAATKGMYDCREGQNARASPNLHIRAAAWNNCSLTVHDFAGMCEIVVAMGVSALRAHKLLPVGKWPYGDDTRGGEELGLQEFVRQHLQWVRSTADVNALHTAF
jgi:hypothetical protein